MDMKSYVKNSWFNFDKKGRKNGCEWGSIKNSNSEKWFMLCDVKMKEGLQMIKESGS